MDNILKELDIKAKFYITRDEEENFIKGTVQFWTNNPKELIKVLLEKQLPMPTVNCSRDGTKCPTSIGELQNHNDHGPMFEHSMELVNYSQRIIKDVAIKADGLGFMLNESLTKPIVISEPVTEAQEELIFYKDACGNCGTTTEDLGMYKHLNEQALCCDCYEKLSAEAEAKIDSYESEESTDDDLPY
jgi:hypothetical protein